MERADLGEDRLRDVAVDEHALERVADAGSRQLAVFDERERHLEVGVLVDIKVADALVVLDDGDLRVLGDEANQALPAARDHEIDEAGQGDEVPDLIARGRRHDDHRLGREPSRRDGFADEGAERGVRSSGLLAAAEQDRVAALDAERGRVDGHVGARLVNHRDDAERDPDLAHRDPVRAALHPDDLADGIIEGGDLEHGVGDRGEARRVEAEPIDLRVGEASGARGAEVLFVGGEERAPRPGGVVVPEARGDRLEHLVLLGAARDREGA